MLESLWRALILFDLFLKDYKEIESKIMNDRSREIRVKVIV